MLAGAMGAHGEVPRGAVAGLAAMVVAEALVFSPILYVATDPPEPFLARRSSPCSGSGAHGHRVRDPREFSFLRGIYVLGRGAALAGHRGSDDIRAHPGGILQRRVVALPALPSSTTPQRPAHYRWIGTSRRR
jgi:hypothetical protein